MLSVVIRQLDLRESFTFGCVIFSYTFENSSSQESGSAAARWRWHAITRIAGRIMPCQRIKDFSGPSVIKYFFDRHFGWLLQRLDHL
jgi:hypothetical protein